MSNDEPVVELGVLGPVTAWIDGLEVGLRGPRHRAVLARLLVAHPHAVPTSMLVEDLWEDPPVGAVAAVRTFVAALRRALEPDRPPRTPPRLLVTVGNGYALRGAVIDADRFAEEVSAAAGLVPARALANLGRALARWRGPALADVAEASWARAEGARLRELRLHAIELQAGARLDLGRAAEAVADLEAHVMSHPWREEGWRLLALALYRAGRQGDALDVLRRARALLVDDLGVDPGAALRRLETDVLAQSTSLEAGPWPERSADRVWAEAAASYDRAVAGGARARLRSTVDLLRGLAITGGDGLVAAREQRLATILAAEDLGEASLTAAIIGGYDVPAIWTRSDDPAQAAGIVAAAERTLAALPPEAAETTRARLLATIAVESRGGDADSPERARTSARLAEQIARRAGDPGLLAFALNGVFMQSFHRTGSAARRDAIGAELIALATRHDLATYAMLGRLIRLQARSAMADWDGADAHAAAADALAQCHDAPLVGVFTQGYRALRLAGTGAGVAEVSAAYRATAARLEGAGMPGLQRGLLPVMLLAAQIQRGSAPAAARGTADQACDRGPGGPDAVGARDGPYARWTRPVRLLAVDRDAAAATLADLPDPPPDHLLEAMWCLIAHAAIAVGDRPTMRRAKAALGPAAEEQAGAGTGLFTLGPVSAYLAGLERALGR
ncbi:AfsR/SARP family transcriptional regulator [Occultella aeris]|uniref:Transcriptional regulatory protein EmbR n=1 Tax=Occultella aeris TaxID=2761496 RepID=A0A7M4DRR0_9MICO|nr:AfsR/SARP family transcriptional regulator [Occultella aeris]VZO40154.1 Transcriptional regulatory protein EmbR [Occultella aeris]